MMSRFVIFFLIVFNFQAAAQRQDSLVVLADNTPQGVLIKWLPANSAVWVRGMKHGYYLERYEVQLLSGKWKMLRKENLTLSPILPWDDDKIKSAALKDPDLKNVDLMTAGKLYDENSNPANAKASLENQSQKNFVFVMALFSQVLKNKTAEAMGTFFLDTTAEAGKIYLYRVIMNVPNGQKADVVVDRKVVSSMPKISGFAAKAVHKGADLYWLNPQRSGYIYYDIYRSEAKAGAYVKINKLPFIGDIGLVADAKKMKYSDTLTEFNKTFYYKVVGINAFEKESPPSPILSVKPVYLIQKAPTIESGVSPDNKEILLTWEIAAQEKPHIAGFSVYHADSSNGRYKRVNEKKINAQTYSYTDLRKNKGSSNYYQVCAFGSTGDSVCSALKAVLLIDSVPPAPPTILSGVCDTNGIVTLTWKKGKEADILGYRVFRTFYTHKEPERITPGTIADTTLKDTVDIRSGWKHLYYGISSIDQHANASLLCKYFAVPLPDKTPPVNAIFKDYQAGYSGIVLKWIPSPSADIKFLHLLKKSEFDFDWQPFLKLRGDSLKVTQVKDSLTKSNLWYEYVLMAEDSAGLRSAKSGILKIQQPEKNPFPVVKNLRAVMSRENKMVKLSWDFDMNATGFKIMRSTKGQALETYEFVAGTKREFYDKWLTPNTDYVYAIIAEVPGGRQSLMSNRQEVKY